MWCRSSWLGYRRAWPINVQMNSGCKKILGVLTSVPEFVGDIAIMTSVYSRSIRPCTRNIIMCCLIIIKQHTLDVGHHYVRLK